MMNRAQIDYFSGRDLEYPSTKYRELVRARRDEFREFVRTHLGRAKGPVFEALMDMAWRDKHDEGVDAVLEYAEELDTLIELTLNTSTTGRPV
jgi:hypothetical protein